VYGLPGWFLAALAASTLAKLYHLTGPATDWHSWNQITTLAQARYLYDNNFAEILIPRVHLFTSLEPDSNIVFGEAPVIHTLIALGYFLIGGEAEWVGRLINIVISGAGAVYLYRLVEKSLSPAGVFTAMMVYLFSPMNLFFHRSVITDVGMVSCTIAGLYYFSLWLETGRRGLGLAAGAAISLAALFKAYALFMGVPFLWLIVRRRGWRSVADPWHLLIAAVCVLPVAAWLYWGLAILPARIPGMLSIVSSGGLVGDPGLLLEPRFYQRILTILADFTLTPVFGALAVYGAWRAWGAQAGRQGPSAPNRARVPDWLAGWLLGLLVYLVIVNKGNYVHDYYQLPFLPALAILGGLGFAALWEGNFLRLGMRRGRLVLLGLAGLSLLYAGLLSAGKHRRAGYIYDAGLAVKKAALPGERVLFHQMRGFHQVLFYTGAEGWKLPDEISSRQELSEYYDRGARLIVLALSQADWEGNRQPLAGLERLAAQGMLVRAAHSRESTDRSGNRIPWVVYRIAERP